MLDGKQKLFFYYIIYQTVLGPADSLLLLFHFHLKFHCFFLIYFVCVDDVYYLFCCPVTAHSL